MSEDFAKMNIKLGKLLHNFRRNSKFISLAIWQKVFELQDDWDQTIK